MEDTITISMDEYNKLRAAECKLIALEGAGVDNWDGYDYAMEMYESLLDSITD